MKKILLFLYLFIIFSSVTSAQDLIITKQSDSISCKINEVKSDKISYNTFNGYDYISREVNWEQIVDTIYNYHIQTITDSTKLAELHKNYIITRNRDTIYCNLIQRRQSHVVFSEIIDGEEVYKGMPNFQIKNIRKVKKDNGNGDSYFSLGATGGFASRLVKKPSSASSGSKKLMDEIYKGGFYNIHASYFFNHKYGLGLQYSQFKTNGSGSLYLMISEDEYAEFPTSLDVNIMFFGLRGSFTHYIEDQLAIGIHLSFGEIFYREEGQIGGIYTSSTGSSFASSATIDLTYYFIKELGVNFNISYVSGYLDHITTTVGEETQSFDLSGDEKLNLNHLQLGVGLFLKL